METTWIKRILQNLVLQSKTHRGDNLIGKWTGKKTRILIQGQTNNLITKVVSFKDKLEVNPNLDFHWNQAKHGLIKFRQEYSMLIFQTKQALKRNDAEQWEIKKLTFNKLILVRKGAGNEPVIEHHFKRSFEGYKE